MNLVYEFFTKILFRIAKLISLCSSNQKLKSFVASRHDRHLIHAVQRYKKLSVAYDHMVWVHVASAGELEQVKPIFNAASRHKKIGFFVTYFSPDAFKFIEDLPGVIGHLAMPLDLRKNHAYLLAELNISHVLFVRYDLWPGLIAQCKETNTPFSLLAATIRTTHSGIRRVLSLKYRQAILAGMHTAFVTNSEDVPFFNALARHVTPIGDPKWRRAMDRQSILKHNGFQGDSKIFAALIQKIDGKSMRKIYILGSPHKSEINGIAKGFQGLLVIAPHALGDVPKIETELNKKQIQYRLFSALCLENQPNTAQLDAIIFDRIGCLAELYALADVAVVGGGFDGGLHNILEAAVHGTPTCFGPLHGRAPEAQALLDMGAAASFDSANLLFQFLQECDSLEMQAVNKLAKMRESALLVFDGIPDTSEIVCRTLETR